MSRHLRISMFSALALGVIIALVPASSASAANGLSATFTKTQDWGTGYEAIYRIANASTATINSWTVEFDLPTGHRLGSLWEGVATVSGQHVAVRNANWNGTIAPGGSASFGFNVSYTGTFAPPANCRLNGLSCDAGGGGGDTQPPTAPGNLRVTGSTSSSVSLAWNASTDNVGVTGYEVFRGTTSAGTTTGTTFTATGLTPNTQYTFTARARDAAGNVSPASNTVTVTTPPSNDTQPPTAPGNLRVTGTTSSSISLAWNASTDNVGVTGYEVFRGATSVGTTAGTTFTVTGLSPSTQYVFTARARDAAGNVSAASNTATGTTGPGGGAVARRVAYFTQWGIYGRNYRVKDIETSGSAARLTHINYAFGNVNEQGRCFEANQLGLGDAWADYQVRFTADQSVDGVADTFNQPLAGNFNQLRKLKARHPNLKVLFSLGGWTWSRYFSNAALPANRAAFVQSCVDMFIRGNLPLIGGEPQGGPGSAAGVFDGIDLDWEWPASEGNVGNVIRPEDRQNFTALLAEFRRQLDAYGQSVGRQMLLTAFLPAAPAKIDIGFESGIWQHLDYATVQGYDLHGTWENQTNHQSQIFSPAGDPAPVRFSVDIAINHWRNTKAAPGNKLVVGVPAYGRGWQGVPNVNNGLYQASGGAAPGTWEAGNEDYDVLKNRAGPRFRDATNGAFWLFTNGQFWSYDDPELIRQKAAYVRDRGLGGLMIWSLDGDDGTLVAAM